MNKYQIYTPANSTVRSLVSKGLGRFNKPGVLMTGGLKSSVITLGNSKDADNIVVYDVRAKHLVLIFISMASSKITKKYYNDVKKMCNINKDYVPDFDSHNIAVIPPIEMADFMGISKGAFNRAVAELIKDGLVKVIGHINKHRILLHDTSGYHLDKYNIPSVLVEKGPLSLATRLMLLRIHLSTNSNSLDMSPVINNSGLELFCGNSKAGTRKSFLELESMGMIKVSDNGVNSIDLQFIYKQIDAIIRGNKIGKLGDVYTQVIRKDNSRKFTI